MKLTKLLSKIIGLFILFVIVFTLSSKGPGNPFAPDLNDLCGNLNHDEDETALLYIQFLPDGGLFNIPHRNVGFESYIPAEDLRAGYQYPESNVSNGNDSYYCFVEVTTPQCLDWIYTTRMTELNGGGNGNITITVPRRDNLWDLNIKIRYYEKCSDGSYSENNGTLRYNYEYTFQGGLQTSGGEVTDLIVGIAYNCADIGGSGGESDGGSGIVGIVLDEIEQQ